MALALRMMLRRDITSGRKRKMTASTHSAIASLLEKSPPFKAAMAVKPLRSAFLDQIVEIGKKQAPIRPRVPKKTTGSEV